MQQSLKYYTTLVTVFGVGLLVLFFLSRIPKLQLPSAYGLYTLLFLELSGLTILTREFNHPVIVFFPVLCFLVTPILGRKATYLLAVLSTLVVAVVYVQEFSGSDLGDFKNLSVLGLRVFSIFLLSYISDSIWRQLWLRQTELLETSFKLQERSNEIDTWAKQMAEEIARANSGSSEIGSVPLEKVHYQELTKNIGEMQKKLSEYLGSLVIKDRVSSIGLLATGVAHELNTPLTSLQFLLSGQEKNLSKEIIASFQSELSRMSAITRQLLTYANPNIGTEKFDVNALVRLTLPFLERIKGDKKIEIKTHITGERLFIEGVQNELEQVIVNIFKNSMDAMVDKTSPLFQIRTRKENEMAVIELSDNGMGMQKGLSARVFEPFYTTKETGKGTGLGLFVVHQIMEKHKGYVEIQSDIETGTLVVLKFPLKQADTINEAA